MMRTLEEENRDLREKNSELAQKVQHLMKEINELRPKAKSSPKARNAKKPAKLTSDQRKHLADEKEKTQVSYFMLPDSPHKGKGKRSDSRVWIPCPLLPGVPSVTPPRKPQPWDVPGSHERTVEASHDVITEGTPPETTENRPLLGVAKAVRKRKIDFSAPVEVIQATNPPLDPVTTMLADIEFIGFTPLSSTSRSAPRSGMSTMSHENDVDNEFVEPDDSGSEIEVDNSLVESSLRPTSVSEYPAELDNLNDPLAEAIQCIGAEADVALRAMADHEDGDLLFFDWRADSNNFEGVREIFTGPSGPMFEVKGLTPLQVLKKFWDDDIIEHIVRETNRYAHQVQIQSASKVHSRISRWRDTTGEEIWRFFTLIMLQSLAVNNVEREYWYPGIEQLRIGVFAKILPYNRFQLLKRCLHFVDNTSLPENPSKLDKVMPVIEHLNKKFSALYLPEQNVAIDESLLLWKGRLSFAQRIETKRAKVGIKSYELCESRTGYLWRMEVYSGKRHFRARPERPHETTDEYEVEKEPESATSQIVYTLMRPLFGKGHTIVMDSFYNAPLLSRLLKKNHKTDTMGTLRLNREFVPETLKCKNRNNMGSGEVCFSTTKDLSVVVWKDNNKVVPMISTFHKIEVAGKTKYGYHKYKPKVVLDYNLSMGGVDHKDQMLHAFPIERVRNVCWYKKLFRRLINVSIHNAFVIYNHDRTQRTQIGNRDFRMQLVREMLQTYDPQAHARSEQPVLTLSQLHLPSKNKKVQRCKMCYENKMRHSTVWRCSTCQVNLCMERCYTAYHIKYVRD